MSGRTRVGYWGMDAAFAMLAREVESGFLPALSAAVFLGGRKTAGLQLGHLDPARRKDAVREDTPFLAASLTKPVVCVAAMTMVQQGLFSLNEPVTAFVPEFRGAGKEEILIRHLFTHTSGLPDQLPEGTELRKRQAPREEFVRSVCACAPLFPPGTRVRYQSMGILMLSEVMERVGGKGTSALLQERVLAPLGMRGSALGMPACGMAGIPLSAPPAFEPGSPDYGDDWNTEYWRSFGNPWGGLHATADDLGAFLLHMLGAREGPLCPAARKAMVRDQLGAFPLLPPEDRVPSWGLGWMLGSRHFGALASLRAFGHVGATGTLFWADPDNGLACVLLTTQPRLLKDADRPVRDVFGRFSALVAAGVPT